MNERVCDIKEMNADRHGLLQALNYGEFDGIKAKYPPRYDEGRKCQVKMRAVGNSIELTTTTLRVSVNEREHVRVKECRTEVFTGYRAVDYIEEHPADFLDARPDLFY